MPCIYSYPEYTQMTPFAFVSRVQSQSLTLTLHLSRLVQILFISKQIFFLDNLSISEKDLFSKKCITTNFCYEYHIIHANDGSINQQNCL